MFITDLLFPRTCIGCGALGSYICNLCRDQLSYVTRESCFYCHKSSLHGLTHVMCRRKEGIDGCMSVLHYNSLLKNIISTAKYRLAKEVFGELFLTLKPQALEKIRMYSKICGSYFLQPVPLHCDRFHSRGFNQALLIAQFFNMYLKTSLVDWIDRHRETSPQAQMKVRKARSENVRGAFSLKNTCDIVMPSSVCIVDDVVTSGSTVREVARVLKKAGGTYVFVLTLARS